MAIAFNRFRQRSFHLPMYNPSQPFDTTGWLAGRQRLLDEFNAVRGPFATGYASPFRRAERLADEVIAEFASAGARDDATITAVAEATEWLGEVGTPWGICTPRPWNYGVYDPLNPDSWDATKRGEERFDKEFALLARYMPIRRALLSALARIAQTVPDEIDRRSALAYHAWPEGEKDPITEESLLALVRETVPAPIERVPEAPPDSPKRATLPALDDLPTRARLAYLQHQQAVRALIEEDGRIADDVTDDAAYQHLKETDVGKLPPLDTWKRNLREARKLLGRQKKKPRPKYDGRSAVPPEHYGDRDDD